MSEEDAAMMDDTYTDDSGDELEEMELEEERAEPRAMEIERLKREIAERKKRIKMLGKNHRAHITKARLLLNAQHVYSRWDTALNHRRCSSEEKRKENLLWALQSNVVPNCMKWGAVGACNIWNHVPWKHKNDREIMLQRLALEDFMTVYNSKAYEVPFKVRSNWFPWKRHCILKPTYLHPASF